jgi:hypothetical protein
MACRRAPRAEKVQVKAAPQWGPPLLDAEILL